MLTEDCLTTMVEEAATTGGVSYEFRALPAPKHARAVSAQRELGEWRAQRKTLISGNPALARAQLGKAVSEVTAQQKFEMGTLNAGLRKENSANLYCQVLGSSGGAGDGGAEEIATPEG